MARAGLNSAVLISMGIASGLAAGAVFLFCILLLAALDKNNTKVVQCGYDEERKIRVVQDQREADALDPRVCRERQAIHKGDH